MTLNPHGLSVAIMLAFIPLFVRASPKVETYKYKLELGYVPKYFNYSQRGAGTRAQGSGPIFRNFQSSVKRKLGDFDLGLDYEWSELVLKSQGVGKQFDLTQLGLHLGWRMIFASFERARLPVVTSTPFILRALQTDSIDLGLRHVFKQVPLRLSGSVGFIVDGPESAQVKSAYGSRAEISAETWRHFKLDDYRGVLGSLRFFGERREVSFSSGGKNRLTFLQLGVGVGLGKLF